MMYSLAIISDHKGPLNDYAVAELRRLMASASDVGLERSGDVGSADIVVEMSQVAGSADGFTVEAELGHFTLRAATANGLLYAVYGLGQKLGFSYHLHGEYSPSSKLDLKAISFKESRSPSFTRRGTQLWNFWYPGRDSWSFADYENYLDQFPKLGLNQLDIPLYHYEPLYTAFKFRDAVLSGHRLSGWSTDAVRVGRHWYEAGSRFTSPDVPDFGKFEDRAEAMKTLTNRVIDHAEARGVEVSLGIELGQPLSGAHSPVDRSVIAQLPDEDLYRENALLMPSSASARELLEARLSAIVEAYPKCEVISFWKPEVAAYTAGEVSPHPSDSALRSKWDRVSNELSGTDLDFLCWVQVASNVLRQIAPRVKTMLSGWGVEHLLEYADETLPDEMIRHSIDFYEAKWTVERSRLDNYSRTNGAKWHTTWAESDQQMWLTQMKTRSIAKVIDGLEARGVEGLLMLHWRRLHCDLNATYIARRCWQPELTPQQHWRNWASEKFGAEAVDPIVNAINELEAFSEAAVSSDALPFPPDRPATLGEMPGTWIVGQDCLMNGIYLIYILYEREVPLSDAAVEFYIHNTRQGLECLIPHAARGYEWIDAAGQFVEAAGDLRERYEFFKNRVSFTLKYCRFHLAFTDVVDQLNQGLHAKAKGDMETFRSMSASALSFLDKLDVTRLVEEFALFMSERNDEADKGELGLLLSLNQKMLGTLLQLKGSILEQTGQREFVLEGRKAGAVLAVTCGSAVSREDLTSPGALFTPWHGLGLITGAEGEPWVREHDVFTAADGFSYECGPECRSWALTKNRTSWIGPASLSIRVVTPAKFVGTLRLYFHEVIGYTSMFLAQRVFIDGTHAGTVCDFMHNGTYADQGEWIELPVSAPDGLIDIRIENDGGQSVQGFTTLSALDLHQGEEA